MRSRIAHPQRATRAGAPAANGAGAGPPPPTSAAASQPARRIVSRIPGRLLPTPAVPGARERAEPREKKVCATPISIFLVMQTNCKHFHRLLGPYINRRGSALSESPPRECPCRPRSPGFGIHISTASRVPYLQHTKRPQLEGPCRPRGPGSSPSPGLAPARGVLEPRNSSSCGNGRRCLRAPAVAGPRPGGQRVLRALKFRIPNFLRRALYEVRRVRGPGPSRPCPPARVGLDRVPLFTPPPPSAPPAHVLRPARPRASPQLSADVVECLVQVRFARARAPLPSPPPTRRSPRALSPLCGPAGPPLSGMPPSPPPPPAPPPPPPPRRPLRRPPCFASPPPAPTPRAHTHTPPTSPRTRSQRLIWGPGALSRERGEGRGGG